jgi:hypothetical protein
VPQAPPRQEYAGAVVQGLAIFAGAVLGAAAVLSLTVAMVAQVSKRRRVARAHHSLAAMRGPSGQPFFPETPEQKRREERILGGWDPTYGEGADVDPERW